MKTTLLLLLFASALNVNGQQKTATQIFDGIVTAGYVDNGAYLNFTGPNISWQKGQSKVLLGMLP
jgi:hypothetical protein